MLSAVPNLAMPVIVNDLGSLLDRDRDLVSDVEVTVVGGVLVDHDVSRRGWVACLRRRGTG